MAIWPPSWINQPETLNTTNHNGSSSNGLCRDRNGSIHTAPTIDPRLEFIQEMWDRITEEIKDRLVEVIQEHAATQSTQENVVITYHG